MKDTDRRGFLGVAGGASVAVVLQGCESTGSFSKGFTDLAASTGYVSSSQANSLHKAVVATARTFEDFTPEQEYYIGRTVGATVLSKYPAYDNAKANRYVNLLGQTLAGCSDRPTTFGGYHFLIQDSEEINAFAAPGGFIFVTRGMLRCCESEDALAATLAHEIGHIMGNHGLRAIDNSRVTEALTVIGMESAKTFGGSDVATLTSNFEGTIGDVTKTLVTNGYSRDLEREADRSAVMLMKRVGYDSHALVDMLEVMEKRLVPNRRDFAHTHPSPRERISSVQNLVASSSGSGASVKLREQRFKAALAGV